MNFKPELVEKIVAGEKTQTRRPVSDNPRSPYYVETRAYDGTEYPPHLRIGWPYAVCPGRGKKAVAHIEITHWSFQQLGDITARSAREEGFGSIDEFFAYIERLYGKCDKEQWVWAIWFKLVSIDEAELARMREEVAGR